jgi:hypothetical protein
MEPPWVCIQQQNMQKGVGFFFWEEEAYNLLTQIPHTH